MRITLAHGAGGSEMSELLARLLSGFKLRRVPGGVGLDAMDDGATIPLPDGRTLVVTADSYTVSPLFFPGGDIGKLAACGTLNDLAVMGADPLAMLDTLVVEEGVELELVERVLSSMRSVLEEEGVPLIGGDFKVMPRGSLDRLIISTVGVGVAERPILDSGAKPGDVVIVTGPIGDHGAVILALQAGLEVEGSELRSDCSPLVRPLRAAREAGRVHAAKDPTRGGLAMALNEIARKSGVCIEVREPEIPVREQVRAYCEMLGVDPLALACEGQAVLCVPKEDADAVLDALERAGRPEARIIGSVVEGEPGIVLLRTAVGGTRLLEPPTGEIVPRIC